MSDQRRSTFPSQANDQYPCRNNNEQKRRLTQVAQSKNEATFKSIAVTQQRVSIISKNNIRFNKSLLHQASNNLNTKNVTKASVAKNKTAAKTIGLSETD